MQTLVTVQGSHVGLHAAGWFPCSKSVRCFLAVCGKAAVRCMSSGCRTLHASLHLHANAAITCHPPVHPRRAV